MVLQHGVQSRLQMPLHTASTVDDSKICWKDELLILLLFSFNQEIGSITGSFPVCLDWNKAVGYTTCPLQLPSKPQRFSEDKR